MNHHDSRKICPVSGVNPDPKISSQPRTAGNAERAPCAHLSVSIVPHGPSRGPRRIRPPMARHSEGLAVLLIPCSGCFRIGVNWPPGGGPGEIPEHAGDTRNLFSYAASQVCGNAARHARACSTHELSRSLRCVCPVRGRTGTHQDPLLASSSAANRTARRSCAAKLPRLNAQKTETGRPASRSARALYW